MKNRIDEKSKGYYEYSRKEMLSFIPETIDRVLDIGCGAGNFGSILKENRRLEVWGVEVCEDAAEEARTKLDNVIIGDFENSYLELPERYFDCIVFNDVLEHFISPWDV